MQNLTKQLQNLKKKKKSLKVPNVIRNRKLINRQYNIQCRKKDNNTNNGRLENWAI